MLVLVKLAPRGITKGMTCIELIMYIHLPYMTWYQCRGGSQSHRNHSKPIQSPGPGAPIRHGQCQTNLIGRRASGIPWLNYSKVQIWLGEREALHGYHTALDGFDGIREQS